jgi:hypothetical protein
LWQNKNVNDQGCEWQTENHFHDAQHRPPLTSPRPHMGQRYANYIFQKNDFQRYANYIFEKNDFQRYANYIFQKNDFQRYANYIFEKNDFQRYANYIFRKIISSGTLTIFFRKKKFPAVH